MLSSRHVLTLGLLAISLAACGEESNPAPGVTPWLQPTRPAPAFATQSPVLLDLQHDYEALVTAHQGLSTIWEELAHGAAVRCGTLPQVPDPAGVKASDDPTYRALAETLRQAAIELTRSRDLWQAECSTPRPQPPPQVIQEGLLAVRAAGDALRQAESLLSALP
jgi:hypothetical protein